jgi:dihydrofolate reductase
MIERHPRRRAEEDTVGTVIMNSVASLDGFIADDDGEVGPLHDWLFNGDVDLNGQGMIKVSAVSARYARPIWDSIGVIVMGRRLFDQVDGWSGRPPAGEHVVVVSHRPKPVGWHPEASYHFADGARAALDKAQELAGDRVIAVNAGIAGSQIFAAGLVDEVAMDIAPVVLGSGRPFFSGVAGTRLLEDPHVVIQGDRVLHLRYKVRRQG